MGAEEEDDDDDDGDDDESDDAADESEEEGLRSGQRPVQQLDASTGEVLRTFPSMKVALEMMGKGLQTGNIHSVCQGRRTVAYGFAWRWRPGQDDNESEEEDAAALPSKRKRRDGDEELLELPALKPRSGKPRQR